MIKQLSSDVSKGGTDGQKMDLVLHLRGSPQPQSWHNLSLNGVLVYLLQVVGTLLRDLPSHASPPLILYC